MNLCDSNNDCRDNVFDCIRYWLYIKKLVKMSLWMRRYIIHCCRYKPINVSNRPGWEDAPSLLICFSYHTEDSLFVQELQEMIDDFNQMLGSYWELKESQSALCWAWRTLALTQIHWWLITFSDSARQGLPIYIVISSNQAQILTYIYKQCISNHLYMSCIQFCSIKIEFAYLE